MNVLVTGGAGYVGSHAVKALVEAGHDVVVVDNLTRGHREAVPNDIAFCQVDLRNFDALIEAMSELQIDCVMHFGALAYVGESVDQPLEYYQNNVAGSLNLLRAMEKMNVGRMVFSSTCATYGEPAQMPIVEDMPQWPVNPYGWSKLFVERMLIDYAAAHKDFAFTALRYFNVAGCAGDGSIGEDHDPETHLIPILLEAALGRRRQVTIFGDDYDTPDGTCIRDYIHVEDLISAHIAAMNTHHDGDQRFFNLGNGAGYSVMQLIESVKRVTGVDFPVKRGPRRSGDPPQLYADSGKLQRALGWQPRYTDIDSIVQTAWQWFKNHPDGHR